MGDRKTRIRRLGSLPWLELFSLGRTRTARMFPRVIAAYNLQQACGPSDRSNGVICAGLAGFPSRALEKPPPTHEAQNRSLVSGMEFGSKRKAKTFCCKPALQHPRRARTNMRKTVIKLEKPS